ncbi:hypothetical protein C5167_043324 [Papaver somniferum]|uniref:Uncharacterized protein n=1 Tax=Papaver somniferum TaxID=3469 RepID=A0A4Y7L5C7_PAPSO|nr:hypothetical protein C5167_043324 [Papaver somniferum]
MMFTTANGQMDTYSEAKENTAVVN